MVGNEGKNIPDNSTHNLNTENSNNQMKKVNGNKKTK